MNRLEIIIPSIIFSAFIFILLVILICKRFKTNPGQSAAIIKIPKTIPDNFAAIRDDYNKLMEKYGNIEIAIHILILLYMSDIRSIWKDNSKLLSNESVIYDNIGIVSKNNYDLVYNMNHEPIIDKINEVKEFSREYDRYLGVGLGFPCPWNQDNDYTSFYNGNIKIKGGLIFNFYIRYNKNDIQLYRYTCGNIKRRGVADLYYRHIMIFNRICDIINSINDNNLLIISRVSYKGLNDVNMLISEYNNNNIINAKSDIDKLYKLI
jgi:hypothetical protein